MRPLSRGPPRERNHKLRFVIIIIHACFTHDPVLIVSGCPGVQMATLTTVHLAVEIEVLAPPAMAWSLGAVAL